MKTDRLLAIVLLLLNRKKLTAAELAEIFETSVRTIYRDMESLSMAGIPLIAENGKNGGYSLVDSYRIDNHFFTSGELDYLISSVRNCVQIFGGPGLLGSSEKLESMKSGVAGKRWPVEINLEGWKDIAWIRERLGSLYKAAEEHCLIEFSYTNLDGEESCRKVEPDKIFFQDRDWYLLGYCRLKSDYRYFKIRRIRDFKLLKDHFDPSARPPSSGIKWKNREMINLKFKAEKECLNRLQEYFDDSEICIEETSLIVNSCCSSDTGLEELLLGFGGNVIVLEPESLRKKIIKHHENALKKYQS